MREIAIYGKGGIGKSTICANLSAALAISGRRVLQIGCDPKHDSTRLLTRGARQVTALDYMRVTNPPDYDLDQILLTGYGGVGCVEAGGPMPGVGCAGRGIISTFELLDRFKLKDNYDHTVYDVLGDVVCGGFAVPIRREYANAVFIVTSGEFMSLYAANNILRGVRNFDNNERRVAGIIYNKRNVVGEDERLTRFAAAVGLPICAEIPRSEAFAVSELMKMTVIEHGGDQGIRALFMDLARMIIDGYDLYEAKPLDDDDLESVVSGYQLKKDEESNPPPAAIEAELLPQDGESIFAQADETRYYSKNVVRGEPLHGCAFNGAMNICVHIGGAVILSHSPKSCAYITHQTISSTGRRTLFERGALLPVSLAPNIECTEMGDTEVVFGGMEKLEEKILEIKARRPRAIIVISSCPAGIIGDDVDRVRDFSEPGMPIVTVKADGNMTGDFMQGLLTSSTSLARQIIKRDVPIIPNTVNVVAEKIILTNTQENFELIESYLARMGVGVNCRFIYDTSYDALENLCSAQLNLPAFKDFGGSSVERFLMDEYGCEFFDMAFPIGFAETEDWLRKIADYFACPSIAEDIIAENRDLYERESRLLRESLAGKKLMVITYNHELDWIIQTAIDVGIDIVKLCLLNYSQDEGFRTKLDVAFPVEDEYDRENRAADIAYYKPDILLTNYQSSVAENVPLADTIPMCPDVGFFSGLHLARRWAKLLKLDRKGEWLQDERLLDKYYA